MSELGVMYATSGIKVTETVVIALFLVASGVAIIAFYLRVPYSVALVLAGLALGVSGRFSSVVLSEPIIMLVFLPPLVFDGAINMHLDELRRRSTQVGVLAIGGTVVTALMIAGVLTLVPGMPASAAFLIAVILAPTDPVSVLAIFKANGVASGLQTLLEGESLFNDALGIVLYLIAVDIVFPHGHRVSVLGSGGQFGRQIAIGVIVGLGVGLIAHRLMATVTDHLVEITLSLVVAYGSFLVADELHGSGIIATVAAGLLIGNYGTDRAMTAKSREALHAFWDVIAFLANSALFLLVGLAFKHAGLANTRTVVAAIVAVVAMLASRAVIAWGFLRPIARQRGGSEREIPPNWRPAIFWGGLRGGIPIALALGLEGRRVANTNTEALVFAVVLFSLIVQGVTYKPLLNRLGLLNPSPPVERTDGDREP